MASDPLAEASLLRSAGRLDAAEAAARKSLRQDGASSARALHLLGLIAGDRGRRGRAVQLLEKARAAAADAPDIACDLGNALKAAGRLDEAVACHRAVVGLLPRSALALSNLATALTAAGRPDEAVDHLREAVALAPDDAELRYNLGNARLALDDESAAETAFCDALRREPGHVGAMTNLGALYRRQGRLGEARNVLGAALTRAPGDAEARWNLSLALLMAGDFEAGWQAYEARRDIPDFAIRRFDAPGWAGEALDGRTLLVHAEQGLGDCLQFCRYLDTVRAAGGPVLFQVPPRLVPLIAPAFPDIRVTGADRKPERFDVHAPLMSLPRLTGPAAPAWPADGAYLAAEPARIARWRERLGSHGGPTVAIAWQGNPDYAGDALRSAPLAAFAPLADIADLRFVSLQQDAGRDQIAAVPWRDRILDPGGEIDRDGAFLDSAAILAVADAVVTTDTALLHLAGATGVDAMAALAPVPDWRWGLDGETTGWYPSLRLFRQTAPGGWSGVFGRIAGETARRLGRRA